MSRSAVSSPVYLTKKLSIKTYNGDMKWVQFRRGPIYREIINLANEPEIDEEGFQTVSRKNYPKSQNIYRWLLHAHNLFPNQPNSSNWLYFCNVDPCIYQNDKEPLYASDPMNSREIPIVYHAGFKNMKFQPGKFLAHNEEQIRKALSHVSYCVTKVNGKGEIEIIK